MKPKIHFTAPYHWINDPNGLIYYKGNYHIFYQHFPYENFWGTMHWGHATTEDFIHHPKNEFVKSFIGNMDAHVLKQVQLGDIAQPISEVHPTSIDVYPKVTPTQTIDDIYGLLAEHEAIVMDKGEEEPSHIVTRQYVFSYLADKNRGVS